MIKRRTIERVMLQDEHNGADRSELSVSKYCLARSACLHFSL